MATNIVLHENQRINANNTENFILIWLDPNVDGNENLNAQTKLTNIFKNFKKFTSVSDGERAIQQLDVSNRVLLIVSGAFGREIVPRIHQLEQVLAIYVFCMERETHVQWAKDFNKVKEFLFLYHGFFLFRLNQLLLTSINLCQ